MITGAINCLLRCLLGLKISLASEFSRSLLIVFGPPWSGGGVARRPASRTISVKQSTYTSSLVMIGVFSMTASSTCVLKSVLRVP